MIENWNGPENYQLLTNNDLQKIIIAFIEGVDRECDEEEIEKFVRWMEESKLRGIIYDLIMDGWIAVTELTDDGPVVTSRTEVVQRVQEGFYRLREEEI